MISTTPFDLKISPVAPGHSSRLSSSTSTTHRNLHDQHVAAFEGTFAPDARPPFDPVSKPWYRDQDYFWGGWADKSVWKSALVECVGTASMNLLTGQIGATLIGYGTPQIGAYIGLSNVLLLSAFIYATAAPSGGHLNPTITFCTMLSGICPVPRAVLYICAQTLGSAVAGGVLAGIWGKTRSVALHGGGCFFTPSADVTAGQIFLNEIASSFVLLFLAFGLGLDPRQAVLFGPRLGPLLVGVALGLTTFASSGMIPGYTGANMNPGRCLSLNLAGRDFSGQWIWWTGPAIAAMLLAALYNVVPPNHAAPKEKASAQPNLA
ncbi:aquaporin-like protein [Schizothecium vesticola]|uniref:Aquaporin-like protein n=1 Tax=Schizothecium vesticola TaxID=314040 RepID=A0AA40JYZ8_9PEZI|nr:aquaporin-like protein [Schizothecium vesticola]